MALVFEEQEDGRKVARLPGGKVVIVNGADADQVLHGERWLVRLEHRPNLAVAHPVERLPAAPKPAPRPLDTGAISLEEAAAEARAFEYVRPGERVAIFVDGPNIEGAGNAAGFSINHKKLRKRLRGEGHLYGSFARRRVDGGRFPSPGPLPRPSLEARVHHPGEVCARSR